MMKCWHKDPAMRPSFTEAMDFCRRRLLSALTEDGDDDGYVENSDELQVLLVQN